MGYVTYGSESGSTTNQTEKGQIGFFALKNDGDEAIVRIMHDTTNDFEIISTHSINLNGKFRRVSCVRNPHDPVSACPLCESGVKTDYRFYIHLIKYSKDSNGTIIAEPQIWERPMSYADKISGYINNYGPMSDVICKIIRHGKAGDMKTEYDIIPNLNKQIYRDDLFVKVPDAFDGFKALGRIVLDKTADEINEYIRTGNFPAKQKQEQAQQDTSSWAGNPNDDKIEWSVEKATAPAQTPVTSQAPVQAQPEWKAPDVSQTTARPQFGGFGNNQTQVQRPTRF